MTKTIYLNYEKILVDSYESNEEWYEQYDINIISATLSKQDQYDYDEFALDFNINIGQKIYVMYMLYSSGDSNGCSDNNAEILWCFLTKEKAINVCEKLNNNCKSLIFKSETNKQIKISNPAFGYFEDNGNIDYVELIVTK